LRNFKRKEGGGKNGWKPEKAKIVFFGRSSLHLIEGEKKVFVDGSGKHKPPEGGEGEEKRKSKEKKSFNSLPGLFFPKRIKRKKRGKDKNY